MIAYAYMTDENISPSLRVKEFERTEYVIKYFVCEYIMDKNKFIDTNLSITNA